MPFGVNAETEAVSRAPCTAALVFLSVTVTSTFMQPDRACALSQRTELSADREEFRHSRHGRLVKPKTRPAAAEGLDCHRELRWRHRAAPSKGDDKTVPRGRVITVLPSDIDPPPVIKVPLHDTRPVSWTT